MFIYVTGDSFADGTGLGDFILENYPGDIPANDFNNSSVEKRLDWQEYVYKSGKFDLVREQGRKHTWGSLIEDKTGIKVINGAYPGSTITAVFLRLISDFDLYGIPEKVFITLPNASRIPIFIKTATTLEETLLSITPVSYDLYSKEQQNLAKAYWSEYSEEDNIVFYLRDIIAIENYVKEKTGNYPVWIDTIFLSSVLDIVRNSKMSITKLLWGQSGLKTRLISMSAMIDSSDTYTADGHFGKSVHEKLANNIIKNYIRK